MNNIIDSDIVIDTNCNICYENNDNIIVLECCNKTKQICIDCISCLTKYICPYCRKDLPEEVCSIIFKNNTNKYNISTSAPDRLNNNDWSSFLENEYLIDPFSEYYFNRDSRILRRRMRQIRKLFLEQNLSKNKDNYNHEKKRRRRNLKKYSNQLTQHYQRSQNNTLETLNNNNEPENIFIMDD